MAFIMQVPAPRSILSRCSLIRSSGSCPDASYNCAESDLRAGVWMRSADTDPQAARVQFELFRAAGPSRRFALAVSLSRTTLELAWRAIERANPTADADQLAVLWVIHCYGAELGEGLRQD